MKKATALCLILVLIAALAGCGSSSTQAQEPAKETSAPTTAPTETPTAAPTAEPTPEPTPAPAVAWEVTGSGVDIRDSYGTKWVRVWALIENTGDVPLYLSSCDIDIEDETGKLVQTLSLVGVQPQVILPGQRAAYEDETIGADGIPSDGLTIYTRYDIVEATVGVEAMEVRDLEIFQDAYGGVKARGRVFNTSDSAEYADPYVAVTCYDADGGYLGTLWTILDGTIPAGERQGFETMGSEWFKASDVAATAAWAYTFQYQW